MWPETALPLLTRAEEVDLAHRIHGTDAADAQLAADELVLRNRGLVRKVGHDYEQRAAAEDLFQAGIIGLIEAAGLFDPDGHPGIKFSTYATPYINKEQRLCCYGEELIATPAYQKCRTTRPPPVRAVTVARRETVKRQATEARRPYLTILTELECRGTDPHFAPSLPGVPPPLDPAPSSPLDRLAQTEDLEQLQLALALLAPLQLTVLVQHYGLDGSSGRTMSQVATNLGYTINQCRYLQGLAIAHLRVLLRVEVLREPEIPSPLVATA